MKPRYQTSAGNSILVATGGILWIAAMATIFLCLMNYFYNRKQVENHPWKTLFSGGQNLSRHGYNFLPPWTGFEMFVLVMGAIGVALIYFGAASDDAAAKRLDSDTKI